MSLYTLREKRAAVQIPATLVTIGLMMLLPFLVHLLPPIGGSPIGPRLLPLFYAPFVAAALCHPAVALVASLTVPLLNHALTGSPALNIAAILTFELVIFSLASRFMTQRWPRFWGAAPLAYLIAKLASLLMLIVLPLNLIPAPPLTFFWSSLTTAVPGLIVLLLINFALVKLTGAADGR